MNRRSAARFLLLLMMRGGAALHNGQLQSAAELQARARAWPPQKSKDGVHPEVSYVTVQTRLGAVNGTRQGTVESFQGVRYAESPVGALRFAPAVPVRPWRPAVLNATYPGVACWTDEVAPNISAEAGWFGGHTYNNSGQDGEDCLWLDVWRARPAGPAAPARELLPVTVWIHGGGFIGGYGGVNISTMEELQSGPNAGLLVGINYRLGPLGFLSSPEIAREPASQGATGGMNGVRDMITALRWIQENIMAFGGDPERVTIMGESSGGLAVCVLAVSPRAKGLFRRAVIQSGTCTEAWGPGLAAEGAALSHGIMRAVNVSSVAALRAVVAGGGLDGPWNVSTWGPAANNSAAEAASANFYSDQLFPGYWVDGWVLEHPPMWYYSRGELNVEALAIGSNSKDGTLQMYGDAEPWGNMSNTSLVPAWNATAATYTIALQAQYGERAFKVGSQYPLARFSGSAASAFLQANADKRLFCPAKRLADMVCRAPGNATAYLVRMTVSPSARRQAHPRIRHCCWLSLTATPCGLTQ
jgi:para-nitrobenzyl esterase